MNSSECQLLEWEKGVPNTVQCKGSDSWKWIVGNLVIDTTDKLRKKIYGYVPNGKGLSIFYPQENLTISCLAQGILNCYLIRENILLIKIVDKSLKGCQPQTCKNGGSCKIADPGTLQERIVCSCKYLSRGYRCEESKLSLELP
ncbi:unnamed protein product [Thelazia callipaeda]|uniref:EGF-like domain-containing protein n=1 Tax=Thelazia callipaeda TaxID=103827 RepID=A0A3P7L6W3_THECL|nr:unnamed protein product [Thelazia callipaeda]